MCVQADEAAALPKLLFELNEGETHYTFDELTQASKDRLLAGSTALIHFAGPRLATRMLLDPRMILVCFVGLAACHPSSSVADKFPGQLSIMHSSVSHVLR